MTDSPVATRAAPTTGATPFLPAQPLPRAATSPTGTAYSSAGS